MNFEDESYVRLYTRDTASWKLLGWEGQTVLMHMLRDRFDRAGVFDCHGYVPSQAVTAVTGLPADVVERGLASLLASKVWIEQSGALVWPKFVAAQTCKRADRLRQQESRRNRRDAAMVNPPDKNEDLSPPVTGGHEGHNQSRNVTLSQAKPSQADKKEISSSDANEPPPAEPATPTPTADSCRKVFEFWQRDLGHTGAKFDRKRKARIVSLLKLGFSVRDLCLAIRGSKSDRWLMGTDPKSPRKYTGIEHVLRDASQVERLIALAGLPRSGPSAAPAPPTALQLSLQEAEQREIAELTAKAQAEYGDAPSGVHRASAAHLAEGIG